MSKPILPVTGMFLDMIAQGHVTPVDHMENLRLPGEFAVVPSITTYGTPDIPIQTGANTNAELGQRPQRNFATAGDF